MLATLQGEDAAMLSFQERMAGFLEAESIEEEVRYYSVLMMDLDASTAEDQIVGCLTDIQEEVDRLYELLPTISTYRHLYHSWLENIDIGRWGPMTGASLPIETRRVGGRWPKDSISSPANAISNPYANAFANPSANPFVNPFANPFASPFGDVSVTRVKGKKSLKPAPSALGLNDQDLDQAEELLASLNKKMASIEQQAKELSKNTQLQEVAEKFTAELDLLKKLNSEPIQSPY
jgi:hypothetical protein